MAVEGAALGGGGVLLAELDPEPRRRGPTLLAAPAARELERSLHAAGADGGEGPRASARGHLCHLGLEAGPGSAAELAAIAGEADPALVVASVPSGLWLDALACEDLAPVGGVLLARLPADRSLAALFAGELRVRGLRARVRSRPPAFVAARRALAGVSPGGAEGARWRRLAASLLGRGDGPDRGRRGERGQAMPMVLAACAAVVGCALVLASLGGAVTGEARVQRAADLSALSAARSMRDAAPRLTAPARLPDGSPNPRHLSRAGFLEAAEDAALEAARRNGVDPERVEVVFPDARETPPLRARVTVRAGIDPGELPGGRRIDAERAASGRPEAPEIPVVATAVAVASPPGGSWTGAEETATGGGYGGPLVRRNGEGMRPDVAAAFDRMAAAARSAGHVLVVNSGFRSDAEQAALFAAHPDPRWVAPPGHSLHRCATELDLGPPSAYGWLAAKARAFGFVQRYSWEPWHYGFDAGPPPCSAAGEGGGAGGSSDGAGAPAGLPSFVPARFRPLIERSAGRWDVSGAMLAAQLMAESGFDPGAVSPAGALGIAQFMPGTAASYGLRDPFDPAAAIDAQAHLMSDLMRQLRSVPLALAAYNAGPGAVAPCMCVPPYPETQAYVARILALLRGAGALMAPELEVRLVR